MTWYKGQGHLKVFNKWCLVECGKTLAKYYCELHNRQYPYKPSLNIPLWGAHISVIRGETLLDTVVKEQLNDLRITFRYSTEIETNGVHYWFPVICPLLDDIRLAFGCGPTLVPYHLSIGNSVANAREERAKYDSSLNT